MLTATEWGIFTLLIVLAVVKLQEMGRVIGWSLIYGPKYTDEFFRVFGISKYNPSVDMGVLRKLDERFKLPKPLFFALLFQATHAQQQEPRPVTTFLISVFTVLNRLPLIMTIYAISILWFFDRDIAPWAAGILLTLMVVGLADIIASRIFLGFPDNVRRVFEFHPKAYLQTQIYIWSKTRCVGLFTLGVGSLLLTSMLSFAAIYYAIHVCSMPDQAFGDFLANVPPQVEFIFLSMSITATQGYGNLVPKTMLAHMAAGLQMLFNIGFIVVFILALSVTFSPEDA